MTDKDNLDRLFRVVIRDRDKVCQICGARYNLQVAHNINRRYLQTRWEMDNACLLCFYCHSKIDNSKTIKVEFFKRRIGDTRFNGLLELSRDKSKIDYEKIKLNLKGV